MKYKAIIFDLDGTLLDTIYDITNSLNYAFKECNLIPNVEVKYVRDIIGNPFDKMVEYCLKQTDQVHDINHIMEEYYKHFLIHCFDITKPFENVVDTLLKLKEQGYFLGVITNKAQSRTDKTIERYFLNIFNKWIGPRIGSKNKPDRQMFDELINEFNLKEEEILYVGDTYVDEAFAKNANVDFALFTAGYGDKNRSYDTVFTFEDFASLTEILSTK